MLEGTLVEINIGNSFTDIVSKLKYRYCKIDIVSKQANIGNPAFSRNNQL